MSLRKVYGLRQGVCSGGLWRGFCSASRKKIGVLGAPFEKGQRQAGVADGPAAIRKTGVIQRLIELGYDVTDFGDVRDDTSIPYMTGPDGESDLHRVLSYNERLAQGVKQICGDGRSCITLGGDHSIAIGTISGHHASLLPGQKLSVLWVDAHADLNTGSSSPSGNIHGMSLSFVLENMKKNILESNFPKDCLSPENLVYVGLRDVDSGEMELMKKYGIKAFFMQDIDRIGMPEVMAQSLEHLKAGDSDRSLHVSFDIDAIDPLQVPATGTPVLGGLTVREGHIVMDSVRDYVKALDMVEVNLSLSDSKGAALTANTATTLLMSAIAGHRGT